MTFAATIVAPLVAALATQLSPSTWRARASFADLVGPVDWFVVAGAVYLYANRRQRPDGPPPT